MWCAHRGWFFGEKIGSNAKSVQIELNLITQENNKICAREWWGEPSQKKRHCERHRSSRQERMRVCVCAAIRNSNSMPSKWNNLTRILLHEIFMWKSAGRKVLFQRREEVSFEHRNRFEFYRQTSWLLNLVSRDWSHHRFSIFFLRFRSHKANFQTTLTAASFHVSSIGKKKRQKWN